MNLRFYPQRWDYRSPVGHLSVLQLHYFLTFVINHIFQHTPFWVFCLYRVSSYTASSSCAFSGCRDPPWTASLHGDPPERFLLGYFFLFVQQFAVRVTNVLNVLSQCCLIYRALVIVLHFSVTVAVQTREALSIGAGRVFTAIILFCQGTSM